MRLHAKWPGCGVAALWGSLEDPVGPDANQDVERERDAFKEQLRDRGRHLHPAGASTPVSDRAVARRRDQPCNEPHLRRPRDERSRVQANADHPVVERPRTQWIVCRHRAQ